MLRISGGTDIFLEIQVVLLQECFRVEVYLINIRQDLFLAQVVKMDFHAVICQAYTREIVFHKAGNQFLLNDKILRQAS